MFFSSASIALLASSLLACAFLLILRGRERVGERAETLVLAALVPLAFVAHLGLLRSDPTTGWSMRAPPPHLHELFHYYLGTKYFAELGYTGLYEATVLADSEDQPQRFEPGAAARDLRDNRLVDRATLLSASGRTRAAFDDSRWAGFKRDLAILRDAHPPDYWNRRGYTIDHGYNATPFVTALLGRAADQSFVEADAFLGWVRILDPYLLGLVGVMVGALEGAVAALLFLFFLFANPMNEYAFIGGAYLRYNHLIALALALLALRQRRLVISGVLFAIAGWLRIFPLVFPALLVLRDLAGPGWRDRLRAHAPLHVGFALASLLILAGTSLVATPDGSNPWRSFAEAISLHAESPSANRIALEIPFSYAPDKDRHDAPLGTGDEWVRETRRVLESRWLPFRVSQALLVLAALLAVRRGRPEEVLLPGLLLLFAASPLSHYYWAMLGLIPLVVRDWRRLLLLTVLLLALSLSALPGLFAGALDLRFTIYSVEILVFLLAVLAPMARTGRGAAIAGAVCLAACSAGDESPQGVQANGSADRPATPVHASPPSGDVYESRALGMSISKPPAWRFLSETSLPVDAERSDDRERLWELLQSPGLTPVVTIAAPDAGEAGPLARLRVVPIRADEGVVGLESLQRPPPQEFIRYALNPRQRHQGVEVLEEPTPLRIADHDAARMVVTYGLRDGDGAARPVVERIVHLRRGIVFVWVEMLAPAPVDPVVEADFDRILASLRVDP